MPNFAAASTLVVVATKWLAMSVPPLASNQAFAARRVGHRLLRREGLAGDHEQGLLRVELAQHRRQVMAVDIRYEVELQALLNEGIERRHDHLRPEVAAADADVDDVADAAGSGVANALGVGEHGIENGMHLVAVRALSGRRAQGRVQHGTALGDIDRLAGQHRITPAFDAAFGGQLQQQLQRRRIEQVLRQVGEQFGGMDTHFGKTIGLLRKGRAQVEAAAVGLEMPVSACQASVRSQRGWLAPVVLVVFMFASFWPREAVASSLATRSVLQCMRRRKSVGWSLRADALSPARGAGACRHPCASR